YTDATSLLRSALPADVRIPTGWATMAELEPHIRVLFKLVDARQASSVELATNVWWLVDDVAAARRHGGDNRTALPLFEQADSFARRVLGLDSPNTLTARANLAASYRQAGRTNDAITIEERVVEDSERLIGVDHPSTLTARANLAASYRQAGRTNDAITLLQEVVDRQDGVIGPDHPDAVAHREALVGWRREADER
ncbi:MAG: tetratricopeptide repeat protein, partial [Candidatus Microthrix parvicella]|nr:tetratricopeptide repeat protein [Candidatus Microthrix parvicella]